MRLFISVAGVGDLERLRAGLAPSSRPYRDLRRMLLRRLPIARNGPTICRSSSARIRGPDNALGRIKFVLPNASSIYLHDTPTKSLFRQPSRAFSSGCVRLEAPMELAAYPYATEGGPAEELSRLLSSGRNQGVSLAAPLPVHITYLTAWLGEDGAMEFRRDVYGWDDALRGRLERRRRPGGPLVAQAGP